MMALRFLSWSFRLLLLILTSNHFCSPHWRGICFLPTPQQSIRNVISGWDVNLALTLADSLRNHRSQRGHGLSLFESPRVLPLNSSLFAPMVVLSLLPFPLGCCQLALTCSVVTSQVPGSTA